MKIKFYILRRFLSIFTFLIFSYCFSQINDSFSSWSPRFEFGNYTQNTSAGVWNITNSRIYVNPTPSINARGVVELAKVNTASLEDKNGGGVDYTDNCKRRSKVY